MMHRVLVTVDVINVMPYPDPDYRFHIVHRTAGGGNAETTFSKDCTAADVYAHCARQGWIVAPPPGELAPGIRG